jgi:nucleoside-diphosphate-sugar epimerase
MRVFIIGATGVIGSRVVPRLIASGHEVTAYARSAENRQAIERAGARAATRLEAGLAGHDAVINLATHVPPSSRLLMPGAWRETDRLRRELPPRIARAARDAGVRRYIQESFAPAYPGRGDRWIVESVPIAPARYSRGIAAAEAAVRDFAATAIVLRFGYFYGADSDFTRDMVGYVRKGWAPMLGSPEAFLSSISHDDAAEAVLAALELPAGTYNVVDDEPVTRRDFVNALAGEIGVRHPRFAPAWVAHLLGSLGETLARSQRISNRKLRTTSPWAPRFPSIRDGWADVIAKMTGAAGSDARSTPRL